MMAKYIHQSPPPILERLATRRLDRMRETALRNNKATVSARKRRLRRYHELGIKVSRLRRVEKKGSL